MKRLIFLLVVSMMLLVSSAAPVVAAATAQVASPNTVKGTINIAFNSRTDLDDSGKPRMEVADVYKFDLKARGVFDCLGTITHLPRIAGITGLEKQTSTLTYKMGMSIYNPSNLDQTLSIGTLDGMVPIDKQNVYRFKEGNLRIIVIKAGKADPFESRFTGTAYGKPPEKTGLLASATKKAQTFKRQLKGKPLELAVTKYDMLNFPDVVLAAGPTRGDHPEVSISGKEYYDYTTESWIFDDFTMSYIAPKTGGKAVTDRLSGTVKWVQRSAVRNKRQERVSIQCLFQ